jgi:hypothetical protein
MQKKKTIGSETRAVRPEGIGTSERVLYRFPRQGLSLSGEMISAGHDLVVKTAARIQALTAEVERQEIKLRFAGNYNFSRWCVPQFKEELEQITQTLAVNLRVYESLSRPGALLCGACTRASSPCQRPAVPGRRRCRLHGGLSSGPKSAEGRARIAESNRTRQRKPKSEG